MMQLPPSLFVPVEIRYPSVGRPNVSADQLYSSSHSNQDASGPIGQGAGQTGRLHDIDPVGCAVASHEALERTVKLEFQSTLTEFA